MTQLSHPSDADRNPSGFLRPFLKHYWKQCLHLHCSLMWGDLSIMSNTNKLITPLCIAGSMWMDESVMEIESLWPVNKKMNKWSSHMRFCCHHYGLSNGRFSGQRKRFVLDIKHQKNPTSSRTGRHQNLSYCPKRYMPHTSNILPTCGWIMHQRTLLMQPQTFYKG